MGVRAQPHLLHRQSYQDLPAGGRQSTRSTLGFQRGSSLESSQNLSHWTLPRAGNMPESVWVGMRGLTLPFHLALQPFLKWVNNL